MLFFNRSTMEKISFYHGRKMRVCQNRHTLFSDTTFVIRENS